MAEMKWVSSHRCKMWDLHDRLGEQVTAASCAELISSIETHGQKHAALGRLRPDKEGFDIELVYGSRRLFAARHLGIQLLVEIADIDNVEALVRMDVENRGRRDISPYERGLSYSRWLRSGLFRNQSDLAQRLGVSEAQVSRLLQYADLPSVVVQAFGSGSQIREEWAVNLAKQCRESADREVIIRRARQSIASTQPRESPQIVYATLLNGARQTKALPAEGRDRLVMDSKGSALFRMQYRAKTIHLVLPRERLTREALDQISGLVQGVLDPVGMAATSEISRHSLMPAHFGPDFVRPEVKGRILKLAEVRAPAEAAAK